MIGGGFASRSWYQQVILEEALKATFPELFGMKRKGRATDWDRVQAAKVRLATIPGNAPYYDRAETAAMLGCSIRQVQRKEELGVLARRQQHGADATYDGRDVRRLASATRKER